MNRQQVKELLPIIQAYAEGKPIEIKTKEGKKWCTFNENDIQYLPTIICTCDFRIKPEPKYRPFNDEEECWEEMLKHQPFGWIKEIPDKEYKAKYYPNNEDVTIYYQVQKVAPGYIKYDDANDCCEIGEQDKSYKDVFKVMTFADGTPFGVKVEE